MLLTLDNSELRRPDRTTQRRYMFVTQDIFITFKFNLLKWIHRLLRVHLVYKIVDLKFDLRQKNIGKFSFLRIVKQKIQAVAFRKVYR